jgi:hypothetical protein
MDSLVAMIAVAAWLLLMVPAALVVFVGGAPVDVDERAVPPALALVPLAEHPDADDRAAA